MARRASVAIISILTVIIVASGLVLFNAGSDIFTEKCTVSEETEYEIISEGQLVTEELEEEESEAESSYVIKETADGLFLVASKDNTLRAYVSGTTKYPVVVVEGNTHSADLSSSNVSTMSAYFNWISNNINDGVPSCEEFTFGCTAFCVGDDNGFFVGRNLDWQGIGAPMVVKCIPTGGYASIGIAPKCCIFSDSTTIQKMGKNKMLASAPFYVTEGMNEKGLTCSTLSVEYTKGSMTKSGGLFCMGMIRYLLDYAADVDEAIAIVQKIGFSSYMYENSNETSHLFVTDSTGRSVAIECIKGKLSVVDCDYIANHYCTPNTGVKIYKDSQRRYDAAVEAMSKPGELTIEKCKNALKAAHGEPNWPSLWSIVFDPKNLTLNVWYFEDYDCDAKVYDIKEMVSYRDGCAT